MAGLAEFMDAHTTIGEAGGRSDRGQERLAESGSAYGRIARAADDPDRADQLLASLFWWCFVLTREFSYSTRGAGDHP